MTIPTHNQEKGANILRLSVEEHFPRAGPSLGIRRIAEAQSIEVATEDRLRIRAKTQEEYQEN
jgi:hypothetical protein